MVRRDSELQASKDGRPRSLVVPNFASILMLDSAQDKCIVLEYGVAPMLSETILRGMELKEGYG
jgi:hypothetical protein